MRKSKTGRWVPEPKPKPEPKPSPWDEGGTIWLPEWIEQAGPMPAIEPILQFWAAVGRNTLEGTPRGLDHPDQSQTNSVREAKENG